MMFVIHYVHDVTHSDITFVNSVIVYEIAHSYLRIFLNHNFLHINFHVYNNSYGCDYLIRLLFSVFICFYWLFFNSFGIGHKNCFLYDLVTFLFDFAINHKPVFNF